MPSRCAASASARTISRAAAASASWRSSRGVVPAWSARPVSSACRRMRAASRVTTPAGFPAAARSRDWSMCSSRNPRRRSSQLGASRRPSGSTPASAIASPSATPSSSSRSDRVVDVEPPDQRPRAERRRVEARALLVGERDHGQRDLRAGGDREAGRHAERAVVLPAVAHACPGASRPPTTVRARRGTPTGCRRGRAPCGGRCPPPGARTSPPPPRPRASTPAAWSPRRRRARSARGRRAAPRGPAAAITRR